MLWWIPGCQSASPSQVEFAHAPQQKKYAQAEPLLLEGYSGMLARKDRIDVPEWYYLDRAREWLVQLYQDWGKPEKAAEWRKKLLVSSAASRKE